MSVRDVRTADDERQLLDRAAAWPRYETLSELTPDALRAVTDREGIDFATALLFDRIVKSPVHGPFQQTMAGLQQQAIEPAAGDGVTLAIAPGAFYLEHPETGADGKAIREAAGSFGCRTALIPTASVGAAAENGRVISNWLASRDDERIVLLSLSKGGTDIKMALDREDAPQACRNVAAWINVGGILEGSPMVSWLRARTLRTLAYRLLFALRGQDFRCVIEMDRRPGGPLDCELQVPEHVQLIHVAGFPLRRHLSSPRARRWHARLAPLGPNDSVTALSDLCHLPGLILPMWGVDHYLQSGWNVRQLVAALLHYLGNQPDLHQTFDSEKSIAPSNRQ